MHPHVVGKLFVAASRFVVGVKSPVSRIDEQPLVDPVGCLHTGVEREVRAHRKATQIGLERRDPIGPRPPNHPPAEEWVYPGSGFVCLEGADPIRTDHFEVHFRPEILVAGAAKDLDDDFRHVRNPGRERHRRHRTGLLRPWNTL